MWFYVLLCVCVCVPFRLAFWSLHKPKKSIVCVQTVRETVCFKIPKHLHSVFRAHKRLSDIRESLTEKATMNGGRGQENLTKEQEATWANWSIFDISKDDSSKTQEARRMDGEWRSCRCQLRFPQRVRERNKQKKNNSFWHPQRQKDGFKAITSVDKHRQEEIEESEWGTLAKDRELSYIYSMHTTVKSMYKVMGTWSCVCAGFTHWVVYSR